MGVFLEALSHRLEEVGWQIPMVGFRGTDDAVETVRVAGTRRACSTEGGGPMKRGWLSCLFAPSAGRAGDGRMTLQRDLGYTRIGAQQAKEIMDQAPDAVVLDVREAEEYASGHIPGAVLLPVGTISEETAAQAIPTKDATVLVYCRGGQPEPDGLGGPGPAGIHPGV